MANRAGGAFLLVALGGCGGAGAVLGSDPAPEPKSACDAPCVFHVAGDGSFEVRDGPADEAAFSLPRDVDVDAAGRLFVVDAMAHSVRMIEGGVVRTIAGGGHGGFRDGPIGEAAFSNPAGIAVDPAGRILIADADNHRVRRIDLDAGTVTTLVGLGRPGFRDGSPETALLNHPVDVAVDAAGNIYIVDLDNFAIRMLSVDGELLTLAGAPTSLDIERPRFVAVGPSGAVYFTDGERHLVKKIDRLSRLVTIAGTALPGMIDGDTASSKLRSPTGIAVDREERIFVADSDNHLIRMISRGVVHAIAGTGYIGGTDGPASRASFWKPLGIALGPGGELFVTDAQLANIRCVRL
ncbi:MAG: hypothetical protein IT384_24380 [Deltaproteobacteria bacterium]|nr:hypothetical protein [Deltaproteobacteria bacterium]